jgi:hypothetical protein
LQDFVTESTTAEISIRNFAVNQFWRIVCWGRPSL